MKMFTNKEEEVEGRKVEEKVGNDGPTVLPLEMTQEKVELVLPVEMEQETEAPKQSDVMALLLGYRDWPKFSSFPKASAISSKEEASPGLRGSSAKEEEEKKEDEDISEEVIDEGRSLPSVSMKRKC